MKRMLMTASVASMIQQFNMHNIHILQTMGYEVHVACNFQSGGTISQKKTQELMGELETMGVFCHQIDFDRNVWNLSAVRKAYQQMVALLQQMPFSFLHCHSPIGGVIGRLAGHHCGVKVMYTAHGFHFYKGAPLINWLVFYPIEKWLSRYTDILITMNAEDTKRADTFYAKKHAAISGVGIALCESMQTREEKTALKQKYGYQKDTILLLSVGELSKRKNHISVLEALVKLDNTNLRYIIAGMGALKPVLQEKAKVLGVEKQVEFLGYCEDTRELYDMADIFVFPSCQEGLPVALMEAMAAGLPVVASDIRGNRDLIQQGQGGFLYPLKDMGRLCESLEKLIEEEALRTRMGENNYQNSRQFTFDVVDQQMRALYEQIEKPIRF